MPGAPFRFISGGAGMKRRVRFVSSPGRRYSLIGLEQEIVELLPRLRRLGRVLARAPADADDLVQLTIERALTRAAQWRPGTRLASWMFPIMKNAWIAETRPRRRPGAALAPAEGGL